MIRHESRSRRWSLLHLEQFIETKARVAVKALLECQRVNNLSCCLLVGRRPCLMMSKCEQRDEECSLSADPEHSDLSKTHVFFFFAVSQPVKRILNDISTTNRFFVCVLVQQVGASALDSLCARRSAFSS